MNSLYPTHPSSIQKKSHNSNQLTYNTFTTRAPRRIKSSRKIRNNPPPPFPNIKENILFYSCLIKSNNLKVTLNLITSDIHVIILTGEFKKPIDVAVCPVTDRVVVTDQGNKRVQVFDASLKHIVNIEKDGNGEQLKWPWGVAVNHAGEIIVSDSGANTVSVYNQNGSHSRQLPGPWIRPWGIAVDINGDIYVCDDDTVLR